MNKINFGYTHQNRDIHPMGESNISQYDMFIELNNLDNPDKAKEIDLFVDRVQSDPYSFESYNDLVLFNELANGLVDIDDALTQKKNIIASSPRVGMNEHNMKLSQNKNMGDYNTRAHNVQLKRNHYKPYKY